MRNRKAAALPSRPVRLRADIQERTPPMVPSLVLAALLATSLSANTPPAFAGTPGFTVLYSVDERGEVTPCG